MGFERCIAKMLIGRLTVDKFSLRKIAWNIRPLYLNVVRKLCPMTSVALILIFEHYHLAIPNDYNYYHSLVIGI